MGSQGSDEARVANAGFDAGRIVSAGLVNIQDGIAIFNGKAFEDADISEEAVAGPTHADCLPRFSAFLTENQQNELERINF